MGQGGNLGKDDQGKYWEVLLCESWHSSQGGQSGRGIPEE